MDMTYSSVTDYRESVVDETNPITMVEIARNVADAELQGNYSQAVIFRRNLHEKLNDYIYTVELGGSYLDKDPAMVRDLHQTWQKRITDYITFCKEPRIEIKPNILNDGVKVNDLATTTDAENLRINSDNSTAVIQTEYQNHTVRKRAAEVAHQFRNDWQNASLGSRSVILSSLASQIADRARLPEIVGPTIAANMYANSGNKWLAATALSGLIYVTQNTFGISLAGSMHAAPQTMQAIHDQFPKLAEFAKNVAPSSRINRTVTGASTPLNAFRHITSACREAIDGIGYGTMPFVIAEKTAHPQAGFKESLKTSERISRRAALFAGGLALALFAATEQFPDSAVATSAMEYAKNPLTWIAISSSLIVKDQLKNWHTD